MDYPAEVSDAASELLMAWTMLDNIRLDAIPSFSRHLESVSTGVAFPSDLKEVEAYVNVERAELLQAQAAEAATLEERTSIAIESFRSFAEILLMQCQEQRVPLAQLEPQFEFSLYELLVEVANHRRSPTMPDPLRDYNSMQTNLRRASHQAKLFACFYKASIQDISISIFHYVVPAELKSLETKNARNWIAIKSCVEKVRQLEHFLNSSISASHGWFFSGEETQLLIKKLQLVIQYVVNELWQHTKLGEDPTVDETAGISIFAILALKRDVAAITELNWMKTVDNYLALVQDYNRECFRDVMVTITNRRRYAVQGDGNCFYRAVVKHFWVNVVGSVESQLAQELRKTLNQPLATNESVSASTESSEKDPYADFTIDDVTDRSTMSTVGVWADHVQVKKMADFLQRPIWIVRHDDFRLKWLFKASDGEWDVSPGPEYKLLPALASGNSSSGTLRPLVLFFTPEVHYDAFLLPSKSPYICPLAELETFLTTETVPVTAKAHNLVHWWFDVENDLSNLFVSHQRALVLVDATDENLSIRKELAKIALTTLHKFSLLVHVTRRTMTEYPQFLEQTSACSGGALTALSVRRLFEDKLQYENPLVKWDSLAPQVLSLSFSLAPLGQASPSAETPLSSIFNRLTTFFESLTSSTLVKRDRSALTESQNGAAMLLASLQDDFDMPPPAKKPKRK